MANFKVPLPRLQARCRFEEARGRERALGEQLENARTQAANIEHRRLELQLRLDAKTEPRWERTSPQDILQTMTRSPKKWRAAP